MTSRTPDALLHSVSITCAAIFLLLLPVRLWGLRKSNYSNTPSWKGYFSAALGILLSIVLFTGSLKVSYSSAEDYSPISLCASATAALGLSLLFLRENQRSHRPSDLATLYLVVLILCDLVYLTVPSELAERLNVSQAVLFRVLAHSILLLVDNIIPHPASRAHRQGKSPQELYGLLNNILFTWLNPILLHGYRNSLAHQDMPPLSQDMKPEFTRKAILQTRLQRVKAGTAESLPFILLECLKKPFCAAIIPRLSLIAFRYSQPVLIRESIRYVTTYGEVAESPRGYWLIVSAVAIYLGLALSTATYQHRIGRLKLMIRSALIGLIHNQIMKSISVAYDGGEATTLMSTDVDNLDGIAEMIHETWAQVVEVLIGIWLLASQVGWIWPLPLFLIYLCSHMSRFVAKNLQPCQKLWNNATQDRIVATSTVLQAMKAVKMLGVQDRLSHRIQELRESELWEASKLRWVMVYYNASANALGIFSPAITLIIFALLSARHGSGLDTETAFTTIAILSMVTHPANMVMTNVPRVVAAMTGFERIEAFLSRPTLQNNRGTLAEAPSHMNAWDSASSRFIAPLAAIQIRQLQVGHIRVILSNIDIDVSPGQLVIISGPTASGKTTILRAILGEAVPAHGSVSLSTRRIAYCAQRPWLPNGSIKDVICRVTDMNDTNSQDQEDWYEKVIAMCCLIPDINSLADRDQTQVGSRGFNLSGGQRQRVALARALFAKCDILLLDDTFRGLDGVTKQAVFDNLFGSGGLMRLLNTTVVLVSNSSQYFPTADHVVVLGNGGVAEHGKWQDIKIKAVSIAKFSSSHPSKDNVVLSNNHKQLSAQLRVRDETRVDLARKSGDVALYRYYLEFMDSKHVFYMVAITATLAFFMTAPQWWLKLWTESGDNDTAYYVGGFLLISASSWTLTSALGWSVLTKLAPQSGLRLHQRLLNIVTSAPMSFFSKTDTGSILNRFSQDIQLIDKQLPSALQTVIVQIFKLIMQIILLCTAEKWLTVFLPASILLVYVVQKVYLRTSRQLRYLELESRAGVFSSFLECIEGIETIRAFGWAKSFVESNVLSVDNSQRPEFLLLCLQRWLNLVLDLLATATATAVIAIAVTFRGHVSGAQVGIALNIMLVANTTLLKLVENWTTLEISLGAIYRLKTLEETVPSEGGSAGSIDMLQKWPLSGHIEFKNITAAYRSESIAIRNFSLDVSPGQKLVICGRTGSGKSTLLLALLRLVELRSGTIELDGIDIKQVRLDYLRQRCFITVSQDPLLLPEETLRFNLDPDNLASDEVLIAALTKTRLWSIFSERDRSFEGGIAISGFGEHAVLDQKLSWFQELSVGQCQLFAIGRTLVKAILMRALGVKPVVILDEVTSSLNEATESTIYRIVDEEFSEKGHTVIVVAHRLGALNKQMKVGRDAVAFMSDGELQEVNSIIDGPRNY